MTADKGRNDWRPSAVPSRRTRAFEDVLNQIEDAIRAGELRPGDRLPTERDLSASLDVSRTSVREAIRVLEALGIVEVRVGAGPKQGVTIKSEPGDELVDLFEMWTALQHIEVDHLVQFREAIEGWACSMSDLDYIQQNEASQEALSRMEALTEKMRSSASKAEYLELDTAFHMEVVRFAGNPLGSIVIAAVRGSIRSHMLRAFDGIEEWDEERDRLTQEHELIFSTLRAGDAAAARATATAHVRRFYSTYVSRSPKQRSSGA